MKLLEDLQVAEETLTFSIGFYTSWKRAVLVHAASLPFASALRNSSVSNAHSAHASTMALNTPDRLVTGRGVWIGSAAEVSYRREASVHGPTMRTHRVSARPVVGSPHDRQLIGDALCGRKTLDAGGRLGLPDPTTRRGTIDARTYGKQDKSITTEMSWNIAQNIW